MLCSDDDDESVPCSIVCVFTSVLMSSYWILITVVVAVFAVDTQGLLLLFDTLFWLYVCIHITPYHISLINHVMCCFIFFFC